MNLFLNYLIESPRFYLSWVFIVIFSICMHECAHAFTALKCGDDTATKEGHLSLNPWIQMGPTSMIILILFGIAWGAVPVNVANFRRKTDGALVAFAGPLMNLVLCITMALVAVLLIKFVGDDHPVHEFFLFASIANGVLFLFNMLPVPMFDGWSIFSLFVPPMQHVSAQQARNAGMMFLALVFLTPLGSVVWNAGSWLGFSSMTLWTVLLT